MGSDYRTRTQIALAVGLLLPTIAPVALHAGAQALCYRGHCGVGPGDSRAGYNQAYSSGYATDATAGECSSEATLVWEEASDDEERWTGYIRVTNDRGTTYTDGESVGDNWGFEDKGSRGMDAEAAPRRVEVSAKWTRKSWYTGDTYDVQVDHDSLLC